MGQIKGRLFTFGCSFTKYRWPTWADILGQEFSYHENWGQTGLGNQYIFNSVVECSLRNNFTKNDKVMVMWTSINREDRYLNSKWVGGGNIYNQKIYPKSFVKKFADDRGYLIRDLASIYATKILLEKLGVDYDFLAMVPIPCSELSTNTNKTINDINDILDLYSEVLETIKPSIFETIFNNDWHNFRPWVVQKKKEYLMNYYNTIKGTSWPSFEKFISNDFTEIDKNIVKEIKSKKWEWRDKNNQIGFDLHPTPLEHLLYLQNIFPEIKISKENIDQVNKLDHQVKNQETVSWSQRQVKRL